MRPDSRAEFFSQIRLAIESVVESVPARLLKVNPAQVLCWLAALLACPLVCAGSSVRSVPLPWSIVITTQQLKECLDFPNSKMQPFIKAAVDFEQPMEEVDTAYDGTEKAHTAVPTTRYEDLYFGGTHILGLHRLHELSVEEGAAGVIKVANFDSAARSEQAAAASSTIARLMLDLYRRRAPLKFVQVTPDNFDILIGELKRYGFCPAYVTPEHPVSATFMLTIRAEPTGKSETLLYAQ